MPTRASTDRSQTDAFTLIELMVVVAIIALLAAVAIVSYTRYIKNSRIVDGRAMVAAIQARQEAYFQQNGHYLDVTGDDTSFFPALTASEPESKDWSASTPTGWVTLQARPESGYTYFSYLSRSGTGQTSTGLAGGYGLNDAALGTSVPWYFVAAQADLDGSGTSCGTGPSFPECTLLTATSIKTDIICRNEGK